MNNVFQLTYYLFLNFHDTVMYYYMLTFIHIHLEYNRNLKVPIWVIKFYMALK